MEVSKLHKLFVECNYLVSTDTRKIIPNSIFFALKGPNFDGNDYAIEAIKKGASYAWSTTLCKNDVIKRLQMLMVFLGQLWIKLVI